MADLTSFPGLPFLLGMTLANKKGERLEVRVYRNPGASHICSPLFTRSIAFRAYALLLWGLPAQVFTALWIL